MMTNIDTYPLQDAYETGLAQAMTTTDTSMIVTTAPDFSFPASTFTYAVVNPGKSNMEVMKLSAVSSTTFTVDTRNVDQGASVTTTAQSHAVGSVVIISDNYAFWDHIKTAVNSKINTTDGALTAYANATARDAAITSPSNGMQCYLTDTGKFTDYTAGSWTDRESGGTFANASETVAGKVELATSAETQAGTDTGGTGAKLVAVPSDIAANAQSGTFLYAADAGSNDTYVITLAPALTAYTTGQKLRFKANTINTGACTLNVNSLGAKSLKTRDGSDPASGYIAANEIVEVIYDGTNFVIQKTDPVSKWGGDGSDGAISGALTITGSNNTYIVKNYTTFTPGSNTVTVTPTNCVVHIKVQGDCDLTDTTIDFSGKGGPGGAGGVAPGGVANGNDGSTGTDGKANLVSFDQGAGTFGEGGSGSEAAGTGGTSVAIRTTYIQGSKLITMSPGAGGGGGGSGENDGDGAGDGGAGGNGGGCIIFEVLGNVTFSSTTATVAGANGTDGTADDASGGSGGGGGGGTFVMLYNGTLSGSLTPTVSGGSGGSNIAGTGSGASGGAGGGGGAGPAGNGANGSTGSVSDDGGAGGNGGDGVYLIEKNTTF